MSSFTSRFFALVALSVVPSAANAAEHAYIVRIENLTKGQVLSPPLVISGPERPANAVAVEGEPASRELQQMAEEGVGSSLMARLASFGLVGSTAVESVEAIAAGMARDYPITIDDAHRYLTVVAMLTVSNDAFFFETVPVADGANLVVTQAYDAGTEFNSESCAFIPGPPCRASGRHDPRTAEGIVAVHDGLLGLDDLNAAHFGWDEIARITIRRETPNPNGGPQ